MDDIEFLICDVAILWRRAFNQQTKALGIANTERRIVISIERNPGATQIEVAQLIDIEPQNLIKPLDKLLAQGLIRKQADKKDRRMNRLFLTPKCKLVIAKINQIAENIRPQIIGGMSTAELQKMMQNLHLMRDKLETHLNTISPCEKKQ